MADAPHQELVIIKRHHDHDDGHHGGAWKIAFADFMTAMMALFLVLWLISATNPKQRATIATYFNPVKLAEMSPAKKGLDDPSAGGPSHNPSKDDETSSAKRLELPPLQEKKALFNRANQPVYDEATMFRDPYAVLADIAAHAAADYKTQTGQDGTGVEPKPDPSAAVSNDAFRDPFATIPQVEPQPVTPDAEAEASAAPTAMARPAPPVPGSSADARPTANASIDIPASESKDATRVPATPSLSSSGKEKPPLPAKEALKTRVVADQTAAGSNEMEAGKLRSELADAMPKDSAHVMPNVEVKSTDEGVLISLTDEGNYAMFAVGSAEPQAKTIEIMAKVAQLLQSHPGMIVIRGHTDGRPYKSASYDNWQLSAARAQMAHYMLVRGGLDEKRIERIEGYADHRPKSPNDRLAPENRRIEILVRKDKP